MPRRVNVNGTWRTVERLFVNVGGTWSPAQRAFVNDNGTWKFAYARTPGIPQNVNLVVNSSTTTNQTTTTSPISAEVTWSRQASDTSLPVGVRWYVNSAQVGGEVNVASDSSAATTFAISPGQTKEIYAVVRVRNGDPGTVTSNDVYSAGAGSNVITVDWPNPTITNMDLTPNYAADVLTVSWSGNYAPSGATYHVTFYDTYQYPLSTGVGSTSGTSRDIPLGTMTNNGYGSYNYDLQQFAADNVSVTFTVTVTMKDSSNTTLASNSVSATYLVGTTGA